MRSVKAESTASFLIEVSKDFPLLAGVVDNRNLLSYLSTGRDSEFKLSLDLLRDSCKLVLIKSDVSAIDRLEDNIARIRSGLRGVAVQLKHVGIRRKFYSLLVLLLGL